MYVHVYAGTYEHVCFVCNWRLSVKGLNDLASMECFAVLRYARIFVSVYVCIYVCVYVCLCISLICHSSPS